MALILNSVRNTHQTSASASGVTLSSEAWEQAWRALRSNIERADRLARISGIDADELGGSVVEDAFSPRADLSRAQVIFLHAACEAFIRTVAERRDNKWWLSSANNARQALRSAGLSSERLDLACVWLGEMAKRRVRIVHYADGDAGSEQISPPWLTADTYGLLNYRLASYILMTESLILSGRENEWATSRSEIFHTGLYGLTLWGVELVLARQRGEDMGEWLRANSQRIRDVVKEASDRDV